MKYKTALHVLEKGTGPILSKVGCTALGLIPTGWPHVVNKLSLSSPDEGNGVDMLLKSSHPHRSDKVKAHLETMVQKHIIERVPQGESAGWLFSMVVVPKAGTDEPRVTVDFSPLKSFVNAMYPFRVPAEEVAQIPRTDSLHGSGWQARILASPCLTSPADYTFNHPPGVFRTWNAMDSSPPAECTNAAMTLLPESPQREEDRPRTLSLRKDEGNSSPACSRRSSSAATSMVLPWEEKVHHAEPSVPGAATESPKMATRRTRAGRRPHQVPCTQEQD
ncbi:Transposon Tf2-6 polyprotein [Caligus rogercresseyi]|uniref:Transposon Tf2-6 polyprotein n=1 Tax=Caligus rogercresseyi TaxID=217165 RepID=A0A7T8JXN0_CALRO|nr:Transposon Tf2-6 polyprotein [Caligus rogercresseyi]